MTLYRIDTFVIPDTARAKFEQLSVETIALLRNQPGFVSADWFEKVSGPGNVNVVTIVAWKDDASIESARMAVRSLHNARGFDAETFFRAHNVVESRAVYASKESKPVNR